MFSRADELVKVGWSKKDRKEYSHRAPRRAVEALAALLPRFAAGGRVFAGDDLLPLTDPADGAPFPQYQVYVALAWLKHLGVVDQHGRRGGYTLIPEQPPPAAVAAGWPGLVEGRGGSGRKTPEKS